MLKSYLCLLKVLQHAHGCGRGQALFSRLLVCLSSSLFSKCSTKATCSVQLAGSGVHTHKRNKTMGGKREGSPKWSPCWACGCCCHQGARVLLLLVLLAWTLLEQVQCQQHLRCCSWR